MSTLRLQAAAERCGCHPDTLRKLAHAREVPATKIGRAWVFPISLLDAWLEAIALAEQKLRLRADRLERRKRRLMNYRGPRATQRTPKWADLNAIKRIYARCAKLNANGHSVFHVDHIVPMNGENVSGLHVENNLRIIPARENMQKGNSWS